MKVLVTGGAGYIGSHVCMALANAGHVPITFDSLETGNKWAVQWGPLEIGDILDRDRLRAVFAQHGPEAVVHLAAYAYVGESVMEPAKYYRNNVIGTLTLLEAMRDFEISKFVFSSSCATYGEHGSKPIDENCVQRPVNPYGASKLMVEQILGDFGRAYNLRWAALRYFNAAGADPTGHIGECHAPETHLIPLVLEAAADSTKSVTVFGTDHPTPDGTCIRDYVHVCDLADAHLLALEKLLQNEMSFAVNLGNSRGYSVREIIQTASRVTGRSINVLDGPTRPGDPPVLVSNAHRAQTLLNWIPRYPSLEQMIETAWNWQIRASRGERF